MTHRYDETCGMEGVIKVTVFFGAVIVTSIIVYILLKRGEKSN
jgi:NADH:ubiquinone oxidoreductase subunit 6 (subunit J)